MTDLGQISKSELETYHCFEYVDLVAGDPETTDFKRRARLRQALWRENKKFPEGSQPMRRKKGGAFRPLGSRIALKYAKQNFSNFLSPQIQDAVRERLNNPEDEEMLDSDRLYCDLLSSMPMCFNLFAPVTANLYMAREAVKKWWPDAPGDVIAAHFEWSPGRSINGEFLENRSAFDVAFELKLPDGHRGVIGIETKYHEDCRREKPPVEKRLRRYQQVARDSGIFTSDAIAKIVGTQLQQIWLDHLLALSMLQHAPREWAWAKFILVHPSRNPSYAKAASNYIMLLTDSSTFEVRTIESLLEAKALPNDAATVFRERYLW